MRKLYAAGILLLMGWGIYHGMPPVSAFGADEAEPICVVTHVDVLPNFTAEGTKLLHQFAVDSKKEPGATRIEVFAQLGRPNHSTVVEIWKSQAAFDAHLASETTKAYRAKLQPMLGSPFDERLHRQTP